MKIHTNTQKIWKAGTGTLVVTVPKSITDLQKLEEGDYVEITFQKIVNEDTELLKKELPKIKDKSKRLNII